MFHSAIIVAAVVLAADAGAPQTPAFDATVHRQQIESWRQKRVARLTAPTAGSA
jgi:hypothetical protein